MAGEKIASGINSREFVLRRYEARLGFYKVMITGGLVGLISVLVPGAIQVWDYLLKDWQHKQNISHENDRLHNEYVRSFLDTAISQDIELRIRFSEYFAFISSTHSDKWKDFSAELLERRDAIRSDIQRLETEKYQIEFSAQHGNLTGPQSIRWREIERELEWKHGEIAYRRIKTTLSGEGSSARSVSPDVVSIDRDTSKLHPDFRKRVETVLERLRSEGFPFELFEGFRSAERQAFLYSGGRSRPGPKLTNAKVWGSLHNYGLAADLVPRIDGEWTWASSSETEKTRWKRLRVIAKEEGLETLDFEIPHVQMTGVDIADLLEGVFPDGGDYKWQSNLSDEIKSWNSSLNTSIIPKIEMIDDYIR